MKVAVEEYELYNNGVLLCKWFDLDEYTYEEIYEHVLSVKKELKINESGECELFVADYEEDYNLFTGECLLAAIKLNDQIQEYDIDEDTAAAISAIKSAHGENYYKDLGSLLEAIENNVRYVGDYSYPHQLAEALTSEVHLTDELANITGLPYEVCEDKSGWIDTCRLEREIEIDNYVFTNDKCFYVTNC